MNLAYKPVVIIGAPRSGTNMLRDVMTALPGIDTWPCDEINYIWRHGNLRYPSDEFSADMARPEVCKYIREKFAWVQKKYQSHTVVEKTCANSLRVGFVHKVVPEAKFIFIYRDGLDVISSALERWKAKIDLPYLLRKARFVPISDLPYYAFSYLGNRVFRLFSKDRRLAFWGPKLDKMEKILENYSLEEACALQWKRCVDKAAEGLRGLESCWLKVAYEEFVQKPEVELRRILEFLEVRSGKEGVKDAVINVSTKSIGKGEKDLDNIVLERLKPLIKDTQFRYGYRN